MVILDEKTKSINLLSFLLLVLLYSNLFWFVCRCFMCFINISGMVLYKKQNPKRILAYLSHQTFL